MKNDEWRRTEQYRINVVVIIIILFNVFFLQYIIILVLFVFLQFYNQNTYNLVSTALCNMLQNRINDFR